MCSMAAIEVEKSVKSWNISEATRRVLLVELTFLSVALGDILGRSTRRRIDELDFWAISQSGSQC